MNCYRHIPILMLLVCLIGCKSYSKYSIDEQPIIKADFSLCGIWKCEEDKDKRNAIIVQDYDNASFHNAQEYTRKEQMLTRSNPLYYSTFYDEAVSLKNRDYEYWVTTNYNNTQYAQWGVFPSEVGYNTFLNVSYREIFYGKNKNIREEKGFFFLRILESSDTHVTTALVCDPVLKNLKSSAEVRELIYRRMNQPAFYSDTLHFYKISNYQRDLNTAVKKGSEWHED